MAINHKGGQMPLSTLEKEAHRQIHEYVAGERKGFDLPFRLSGTAFERAVYEQTMTIPYGETKTYGDIAKTLERPGASRAVGNALNKNPLFILVPCHRVVAKHDLGGFGGGVALKERLLALEQSYTG